MNEIDEIRALLEQFYSASTSREQELHLHRLMQRQGNKLPPDLHADAAMIADIIAARAAVTEPPEGWSQEMETMIANAARPRRRSLLWRTAAAATAVGAVAASLLIAVVRPSEEPNVAAPVIAPSAHAAIAQTPTVTPTQPSAPVLTPEVPDKPRRQATDTDPCELTDPDEVTALLAQVERIMAQADSASQIACNIINEAGEQNARLVSQAINQTYQTINSIPQ